MKRKLFSAMLSAFALLLLMGAAASPDPAYALVAEEESVVQEETALETEAESRDTKFTQAVVAAAGVDPTSVAVPVTPENTMFIDGQSAPQ